MGPNPHLWFSACKTACLASELLVSMGPSSHLWVLHAKHRFWSRITNLYGSQRSPVVLCMQYCVISTRSTCLYRWQPLSVVFAGKTATFRPEQQVPMGPSHPLSLCACTTAWIAPEILVSMGPSPHLRFLHSKQRHLEQLTSLYGYQNSPVVMFMQNSVISTRITLICGFVHSKQQP